MQVFLNLVLEYVPETVYRIGKHYSKAGQRMPTLFVKLYVWQVCHVVFSGPMTLLKSPGCCKTFLRLLSLPRPCLQAGCQSAC